jgi:hypothetical protein
MGFCEQGNEHSDSFQGRQCDKCLNNHQLLGKDEVGYLVESVGSSEKSLPIYLVTDNLE